MDIDGDGGRREFGLRGQRRGTERSQKSIPADLDILKPEKRFPFATAIHPARGSSAAVKNSSITHRTLKWAFAAARKSLASSGKVRPIRCRNPACIMERALMDADRDELHALNLQSGVIPVRSS